MVSSPHDFKRAVDVLSAKYNVIVPCIPATGLPSRISSKPVFRNGMPWRTNVLLEISVPIRPGLYLRIFHGRGHHPQLAEDFQVAPPDGIITVAAPVFLNDPGQGVWYDWRLYFSRFFAWFIPEIKIKAGPADLDGADRIG